MLIIPKKTLIGLFFYFPWHCLYFFPLPHAPFLSILSLYLVHIVLWLLALFYRHLVHIIISIICIINITNNLFNVDKMWTKSSFHNTFCLRNHYISYLSFTQCWIIIYASFWNFYGLILLIDWKQLVPIHNHIFYILLL